MAKFKLRSKLTGQYIEITQEAIETPVEDMMGYFEGKDVETVLSEIGMKIRNGVATPHDIDLVRKMLDAINDDILSLKDGVNGIVGIDTETLKEMVGKYEDGSLGSGGSGGGGGGSIEGVDTEVLKELVDKYLTGTLIPPMVPTIESNFPERVVVEEGSGVTIDIFFQTPNLGSGTLYITVNNAEIDLQPEVQTGDNNITIKGSYLNKTNNVIDMYVKDRVGMTSNKLSFTVVSGGVAFSTTFDHTVDYVVGQNILFPFTVTSEIEGEIILYRTIDGLEIEPLVCARGYNSFNLNDFITGVGSHSVSMYAMVGTYKSKVINFNVVIASSTQLSLSSSTLNGSQFTYGEAIQISYRVSKLGNETFTLKFYIDDELMRTANVSTGSYIWTIAAGVVSIGQKTVKITAEGTTGDKAEVTILIEVVKGAFNPIEIIKGGMSIYLDADGYSNEMNERTIWADRSGKNNHAELIGFNFRTNGWNPTINEVEPSEDGTQSIVKTVEYKGLVCNNDAYVKIPYKPFYNNVINGFTMELLYTPEHSGNNNARVLEYVDHDAPYVGVYANIDEAFIKSESETTAGQVDLDYESGEIQLDFVIDRDKKLCLVYIDGICTRYWSLSDSGNVKESFAIDQDYIYLNFSALDPNYCGGTNVIRKFICYERPLSHSEIENNWIANAPTILEMESRYNWCYNTQIPKVQVYGDISNISSSVPAYVRIKYISPDENKYGASFDLESANSPIYLQGTSSLGYSRKNYRFVLIDNNGQQYYHEMFPGNALPESTYTAKCDYVDSSMTCNVSLCKIANDTLYGPSFTDAQRDNPRRRTATYGHAIELVNIVNNVEVSLGAYTLIIDRYAEESMGYKQSEYPNILVLEGESNSDTGASSFHAYTNPASSGSQFPNETEYINEGFRVVYPPTNEAAYDFADVKELVNFVDLASDDDFKDTFESYFHKESVLKYYLFCLCFASVDTLAKNLHFVRYKDLWYILPYDCDSVLGGSNVGFLNISSSCEVGNVYDEQDPTIIVEPNQYNSWNGRLWERMRNTFSADLISMWTTLRSNGTFNYDNFIKYFNEIWDVIPPSMYNSSQQIKYIDYGTTGQVALHGNRKHQIKKFLRERIAYLDSKFGFYSDGGAENYANIRMNVLGDVSLTVETYYPVYYTIKWATNNIETHRIAKNTKYTFRYFSDVSTDREVLLYLPHTLKTVENLDSLQPASIDISKAVRLNKIEVHSKKLYSVNLTNNKYLRTIDFNGCELLGTDTISTMSILYAKYLKYLDVRGTKLTAVNFSPQGGSLVDCYLPETITSLTMKHQLLLKNLILPSGDNAAKELASVEIDNCPEIIRMSEDETKSPFDVFKYCRSLIINNSFLSMNKIVFDGFTRLQTISLSNMESLTDLGLNDLCIVGEESSLRYIGMSACKNLTNLALNCTSDKYEIAFANKSLLDLSTSNVTELSSNCVIKGLETIVLPVCIENMYFTKEFGSGYSDIKNIWSAGSAVVDSSGVFPVAKHLDYNTSQVDDYEGIDFYGLHLYNIDLGALVNIPAAKNFSLYPTDVNPNFNLNRDGVELPFLQPIGVLDLSNYTQSLAKFFNGVNLDRLYVACRNDLPQTDLSYCFYGSTFSNESALDNILNHIKTVSNMEYCFYRTSVGSPDVLSRINFLPGTSLRYCFAECPNITKLENVTLSSNIGDASYMFSGCGLSEINNVTTSCQNIVGMFSRCDKLMIAENFNAVGTSSYESLFEGCNGMTVTPITSVPDTITNISKMYKDCKELVSIDGFVFHANITNATDFVAGCDKLINANNVIITGPYYNDIFRGLPSLKYVNNLLISFVGRSMTFANMFDGCSSLEQMSFHDDSYVKDVISMDYMFRGTAMRTVDFSNVNFEKITSIKYMFADCSMTEFSYTVPNTISSIQGFFSGCRNLRTLRNFNINTNVNVTDWLENTSVENLIDCSFYGQGSTFKDYTSLKNIDNVTYSGSNFSSYFEGCTSLTNAKINIPSNVTRIDKLFANCPNLTEIEFDAASDLSKVTTVSGLCSNDTSLNKLIGLNITNSNTAADNSTLVGCPINNTDGLYINSNAAINMFRMGEDSKIVKFTDFELGTSCTDLNGAFKDYESLIEDVYIPVHVTNVSQMFTNCINLTHAHSNWTNPYTNNLDNNFNNNIVTTDCYLGCDNIRYIDDELYMNEYGELTAMSYIPPEWGGEMAYTDDVTIFDIKLTDPTNLTYELLGDVGQQLTNWGDGTEDMTTSHTYLKTGIYTIVTKNVQTFGQGTTLPDSVCLPIIRLRHLNKSLTKGRHLCRNWKNLLKVDINNHYFDTIDEMFNNCQQLTSVDLSSCTVNENVTNTSYLVAWCYKMSDVKMFSNFANCTKITNMKHMFAYTNLTYSPISVIPDSCENITKIFFETEITDLSGLTIGSGVTTFDDWKPAGLTVMNDAVIRNSVIKFTGDTVITSMLNLQRPNSTDWTSYFEGCTSLVHDIDFPSNTTNVTNCFKGCTGITHATSNWDDAYENIIPTDCYSGCTEITHIDGVDIGKSAYVNGLDGIPPAWGGYGMYPEHTTICEFEVDEADLTLSVSNVATSLTDDKIIDWGDGTVTYGEVSHTYAKAGVYIVKGKYWFNNANLTWRRYITKLIKGTQQPVSAFYVFAGGNDSKITYADFSNMVLTNVSGMVGGVVGNYTHLTEVRLNNMTVRTGDLSSMFATAMVSTIDLSTVIFENPLTSMSRTFYGCPNLTTIIGINRLDTSTVTGFNATFAKSTSLTNFDFIKSMDFSSGSNFLDMFNGCTGMTTIDMSNWRFSDTKLVDNIRNLFYGCTNLATIIGLENLNTKMVANMQGVFRTCASLTSLNIGGWDTTNVTDISHLCNGCTNLATVDVSGWNVSKVTTLDSMFNGCSKLKVFNAPNWNTAKATSFVSMFAACTSLTSLDFSSWTMNATKYNSMLAGCTSLTSVKFPSDIAQPTDVTGMFSRTSSLMHIENCPIITRGTSGMTYMYWAYSDANTNPIGQLITFATNGELGNWDIYYNKYFFRRVASETITNIANAAYDYTTEGKTFAYNTNGSLAYFTDAQIAVFTNKGWTLT